MTLKSGKRGSYRIFVCEYVSGGGCRADAELPAIATEGDGMLRALLHDLRSIDGLSLSTARDARLPPIDGPWEVRVIQAGEDPWPVWREQIEAADAVWPVAPETGGALERLSRMVEKAGRTLLGSRPDAVALTSSKLATARLLAENGIPVIESYASGGPIPDSITGWITKPDNGAGCESTYYFADRETVRRWRASPTAGHFIVQPYIEGVPASLSVLCYDGSVTVLAYNRQDIELSDGQLHFRGVAVGGLVADRAILAALAQTVGRAIPGLRGYAGIDLVLSAAGPMVVEVNPRLTTAYVGLRSVIRRNPAELLLPALGLPLSSRS
ncbi:MAG: ATP-grasp domain-containing protein [Gammaproteobacteria bacterium]